jgi:hypothetical protein
MKDSFRACALMADETALAQFDASVFSFYIFDAPENYVHNLFAPDRFFFSF